MYINPPLNFTGSKFKLLSQILPEMDYTKTTFVDTFMGGGSVYSNLLDKYDNIVVNDVISDLVRIHKQLGNSPSDIIKMTKKLASCKEDKDKYLELRESYNNFPTPEKLWALMLSCTSNLMRFNKSFKFNQTWGKREWNNSTEKKTNSYITHLSNYNNIKYISKSFHEIPMIKNSMVYLDPPYINSEAGYNAYWSKELELKLFDYIKEIDSNGNSFMISGVIKHDGNESELLSKLKSEYNLISLDFNYNKVSRSGKKETKEVIIKNY